MGLNDDIKCGIELKATDHATKEIKKTAEALKKVDDAAKKFDAFGKSAVVAGLAATGGLIAAAKTAADFEKSMSNVSTLVDTQSESMSKMSNDVLEIAKRTPVAMDDLTASLYNVRSAGIDAGSAMSVLEKSAQLGIVGLGSTEQSVDLVTSAMNAWGLKGEESAKIYDVIFRTCKTGKTTISGLAQGFGAVAGTVANANIKVDEYFAAVAAMTTTGAPAAQCHTQIKAAIAGMTRETKESKAVLHSLGAKNFKDLVQKSGGMVNAFGRISKALKGNDAAILQIFGSTEAYNAVIGLTGKQHKAFAETLDGMRDGTSLFDEGYQKQLATSSAQLQIMQNRLQKLGVTFGSILLPPLNKFVGKILDMVEFIDKIPQPIKSVMVITTAIGGVALLVLGGISLAISSLLGTLKLFCPELTARVVPAIMSAVRASFAWIGGLLKNIFTSKVWTMSLKQAAVALWGQCKALAANTRAMIVNAAQGIGAVLKGMARFTVALITQKIPLAISTIANLGFAGSFRALGAAIISVPIIGWVIGLVTVAILLVKNWDKVVACFKKVMAAAAKLTGLKVLSKFAAPDDKTANAVAGAKSVPVAKSSGKMPKYDVGSRFITQTGLGIIHKGEEIAPAGTVKSVFSRAQSSSVSLTYAPSVNVSGGGEVSQQTKSDFLQMLKSHRDDIISIINQENQRRARVAY